MTDIKESTTEPTKTEESINEVTIESSGTIVESEAPKEKKKKKRGYTECQARAYKKYYEKNRELLQQKRMDYYNRIKADPIRYQEELVKKKEYMRRRAKESKENRL